MYERLSTLSALAAILWTVALMSGGHDRMAVEGLAALFVLSLVFHALDLRRRAKTCPPAPKR